MVRLERIEINGRMAEADFYPEDSTQYGHVVVNLDTRDYTETVSVSDYGLSYAHHAARELVRISKEGDIPERRTVMWY